MKMGAKQILAMLLMLSVLLFGCATVKQVPDKSQNAPSDAQGAAGAKVAAGATANEPAAPQQDAKEEPDTVIEDTTLIADDAKTQTSPPQEPAQQPAAEPAQNPDANTPPVPPAPVAPKTVEFTIESDDHGFYPAEPITIAKGDSLKINFKVRKEGIYYGGMRITSDYFNTGDLPVGGSKTVEYKPDASHKIESYWPSSGVKKAEIKVEVK